MFELIVTAVSTVTASGYTAPVTAVHRFEFDTEADMRLAVTSLIKAKGVTDSQFLEARLS